MPIESSASQRVMRVVQFAIDLLDAIDGRLNLRAGLLVELRIGERGLQLFLLRFERGNAIRQAPRTHALP